MKKVYIIDDAFEVSDEVKNMFHEEKLRRITILEAEAIEAEKDIPEPVLQVV